MESCSSSINCDGDRNGSHGFYSSSNCVDYGDVMIIAIVMWQQLLDGGGNICNFPGCIMDDIAR